MSKKEVFSLELALNCLKIAHLRPTDEFVGSFGPPLAKGESPVQAYTRILSYEKGPVFDSMIILMGVTEKEAAKRRFLITFLDTPTVMSLQEAQDLVDRDYYPTWKHHLLEDHKKVIALKKHLDHINRTKNPYPLPDEIELIQSITPHEDYDTKGDPTMFIVKLNGQTTYRIDGKFDSWDYGNPEMVTYRNILEMKKVKLQEKVITVYE